MSLENEADSFIARFLTHTPMPQTQFDPDWPSECEQGLHWRTESGAQEIKWLPKLRPPPYVDFDNLEAALEFSIHDDIKLHYGRYWSANIPAHAADGDLTLLYTWNPVDVDNLIENLIGHAVACRNNKTPFSVFFAVAEPDSDYFLTVNNTTGEVQLEEPGKKPLQTLASNLTSFMGSLKPGWKNG